MQNKFQYSKPLFTDLANVEQEESLPLKIFSIPTAKKEKIKQGNEEMEYNSNDVFSTDETPKEVKRNPLHSWTEGSWAFRRSDIEEEIPSLEVRQEAMKRIFQSLEHADGRSSRLDSLRTPEEKVPAISKFHKDQSDEYLGNLHEAVEKKLSENFLRLSSPNMSSGDVLDFCADVKPKTAPSGEQREAGKQYYFPELRNLIEDRIEEAKVETLTNRLERELLRRQHLCNEQALMLQMMMNRIHDLEKRQPKRATTASSNSLLRHSRVNDQGVCCCTSNYVVEKATQTPSDIHDAEGVFVMVARNSGAKAKKVQRKIAYGYPEKVTEEKKVSTFLDRKIVTQHIEFLPPIPDPFARKRPRDAKRPGWHTI